MRNLNKKAVVCLIVGAAVAGLGLYAKSRIQTQDGAERSAPTDTESTVKEASATTLVSEGRSDAIDWAHLEPRDAESRFLELRSRAEAGDVVAQRHLAELFQRCSVFSLSPSNMYSTLDAYARIRGVSEGAYNGIKKRFAATCSSVDGGQVIPQDAYMGWFERAARQGDPYAKVTLASKNFSNLKANDYQALARDVVNSADPEAIFALGDLLALAPQGADLAEYRSAVTGPYASYAWGIAACRMGADCGPASYRMDSLCINTGICGSGDYESAIRTDVVPAGQQESLDKAIGEVQKVVGNK
ncbi:hypothetical protein ACQ5SB_14600 [Stenotrophomonas geniculata]|uniref:hypothetical protein n=1 Tax=Stenotrophomonas TaxID=40323 RepID=UPI003D359200